MLELTGCHNDKTIYKKNRFLDQKISCILNSKFENKTIAEK